MIRKLLLLTTMSAVFSVNAQFDMGGEPEEDIKKTKKEITSPTKEKYSDAQKKHQNKIVFSNSSIEKNNENASAFVTTWVMGDPLYIRNYFSQTLMESVYDYHEKTGTEFNEYAFDSYSYHNVIFINGKEMTYFDSDGGNKVAVYDRVSSSGIVFDLKEDGYANGGSATALRKAFQALGSDFKEGTYEVLIEQYAVPNILNDPRVPRDKSERQALMCSGKLTVKVTKDGMNKYAKYLCRDLIKKEGQMVDSELEASIVKLISTGSGITGLSANITDLDWTIERNAFGVVTSRIIEAKVSYKTDKGEVELVEYVVRQMHDGSNFQKTLKPHYMSYPLPYCSFCSDY